MSAITVVTTFHKPGLDLYGQRFLDSFAQRVDPRIKLLVYAESCNPKNPNPEQITILNAKEVLPKLNAFKEKYKDVPHANGGRGKGSQTWPECGFYGMNLNHPVCGQFLKEFERMYEDADNGIFRLVEWHDSFVFGHIIKNLIPVNNNVLDYSAEMYLKEAKSGGGGHPLINTVLGKWIDHMKGARKNTGKSKSSDIMVNRKESYWK